MNVITPELQKAVFEVFARLEKHGCVGPWGNDPEEAKRFQFDACAVLVDAAVTPADIAAAYGALMAMECIRYKRWPSNREILDTINSRRPHASETAVKAEATAIFSAIVREVEGGRHRQLETRVRGTFGLAAAEALAAIGGGERVNSAGSDYMGALWNAFSAAYVGAVAGGRARGDAMLTLPAPKPLQLTGETQDDGPKRISGVSGDVRSLLLGADAQKPRITAPIDRESSLARLRRQAQELLSGESA